jgi:hypothetical protein
MKLYTEEQVIKIALQVKDYGYWDNREFTHIELPSDEEILEKALKQFPYPNDIKDKNDEIIKTFGVKPFNYAKIEKYRNVFTIGAKWMRDKIKGGNND